MTDTFTIQNDILITADGLLFLLDGNHSVLKFITGESRVADESIENFRQNLVERRRFCEARGIAYQHVVFPDKQSVLTNDFPIDNIMRLAEHYVERDPRLRSSMLYPLDVLQGTDGVFQATDSHMTDLGSIIVIEAILDKIGYAGNDAVNALRDALTREDVTQGDLALRLDPVPLQTIRTVDPTWTFKHLTSATKFNQGLIDLVFNPSAAHDKTLLIFGDSFFRSMLKLLSRIFSRVVCLRSRFLHREMVELVAPDVVLTGNVERYLDHVASDRDAPPFMFYSYMRPDEPMDASFLTAYEAFLSPTSQASKAFLASW